MEFVLTKLREKYTLTVVRDPKMFRGIQIHDSPDLGELRIDQSAYLEEAAARYNITNLRAPECPGPAELQKTEERHAAEDRNRKTNPTDVKI